MKFWVCVGNANGFIFLILLSFEKAVGLEFLFFIIIRTFMIIENRYINSILLCIFKHHYSMPM